MKYTLLYFLAFMPWLSWGQTTLSKTPITVVPTTTSTSEAIRTVPSDIELLKKELDGTFYVETNLANYQVLYTQSLLETIKASRKATEIVRFNWDNYVTIVILPLSHTPASISPNPTKSE
ncbi:hypothetical protein [Aureispira sp. CCB-E]|uniref:hypothetical protein n=1 Tax=Aureispira sp. CCB-E TaxID=3051121 RepID=UPI002868F70B|nr:hypothetical protein [Aureispira sp. CCB-E]WMX15438.1 hypothetical protein QP953_03495 [Aureispira sp. CCB-E]